MTRRPQRGWPPASPGRRGFGRSYDPFYQFEQLARDNGKPHKPPEPKPELLLSVLGSKAALVAISCLLAVVVATLLALMVTRL